MEHRNPIEDSELRMLAEHIDSAWQTLAFFLDMDTDEDFMEQLNERGDNVEAAYQILKKWNHNYTGTNPQKDLARHLQHLSLPLVASHFEQGTLDFYKATAHKRFL